ncbi:prolyl oligopeptidase family serine peptidase [Streptomyces sp. NPDC059104]|uniref:prolyl oligopeptidase family serine peptidase n=1 Tax=Streptomyces sp. NPDC059104 TaxID=3346729 RepID=UPI00367CA687
MKALHLHDLLDYRLPGEVELHPDGNLIAFTVKEPDPALDRVTTSIRLTDADGSPTHRPAAPLGASSPRWSPLGDALAYLAPSGDRAAGALRIKVDGTDEPLALLPGVRGVGQPSWSPDGLRISFLAPDFAAAGLPDHQAGQPTVVRRLSYKADGVGLVPDVRRHLYTVHVPTGEVQQLTSGDYDVHAASWSPDGRRIAFSSALHQERELDRITRPFIVDVASGTVHQAADWNGTVSWTGWEPDGRALLLAGQHLPGPNRLTTLFRLDLDSGRATDLLPGFDRRVLVPSSGGAGSVVRTENGDLIFCAREQGCTWVYRLAAGETTPQPLVSGPSTVVTAVSQAGRGKLLAMAVSDATSPGDIHLCDPASPELVTVTDLHPGLDRTGIHQAEPFSARTADGVDLHGYLVRGAGSADGSPAPLLVDIHGGPDNAWRPNFSPYYLYRQVLAERGWNILLLNPRGSDGYGEQYMRAAMGRLGFSEEEDFLAAVDALVDRGLADPARVAVMGSSHGGFMTTWLTARTDRFAAGISVACISNWLSLYGTSSGISGFISDQMGGSPYQVPEVYRDSSPLTHAANVRTPTLIVHGEYDFANPVGQSEEWHTALLRQGCEVEFVRYPEASHLFMYNGRLSHQLDYAERIVNWLVTHAE